MGKSGAGNDGGGGDEAMMQELVYNTLNSQAQFLVHRSPSPYCRESRL